MDDMKITITPEEAEVLLPDGDTIHNYTEASFGLLGSDYTRDKAVDALRSAYAIEIGGDACKSLGHALVVWKTKHKNSFFRADNERVAALEAEIAAR